MPRLIPDNDNAFNYEGTCEAFFNDILKNVKPWESDNMLKSILISLSRRELIFIILTVD